MIVLSPDLGRRSELGVGWLVYWLQVWHLIFAKLNWWQAIKMFCILAPLNKQDIFTHKYFFHIGVQIPEDFLLQCNFSFQNRSSSWNVPHTRQCEYMLCAQSLGPPEYPHGNILKWCMGELSEGFSLWMFYSSQTVKNPHRGGISCPGWHSLPSDLQTIPSIKVRTMSSDPPNLTFIVLVDRGTMIGASDQAGPLLGGHYPIC